MIPINNSKIIKLALQNQHNGFVNLSMITSAQNPGYKELQRLTANNNYRRRKGVILVEGIKENLMALNKGLSLIQLYSDGKEKILSPEQSIDPELFIYVQPDLFNRLVYRPQSHFLGIYKEFEQRLDQLSLSKNPIFILLEKVEKPGNLGAVIRTADAVGADAVILCDPKTDFYNPNVIRSSVGTFFAVPTVTAESEAVYAWCRKNKLTIFSAALENAISYTAAKMDKPCAIIFGTEAEGLSDFWLENADAKIKIPMLGKNDSLNVSNSVAVIAYEALRQRTSDLH